MVGGGQGAFIGAVHRIAARIDDQFELVAGALSSDPARAKASAQELGLAADRIYGSIPRDGEGRSRARRTASRRSPSSRRTTCTSRPAKAFLEAGIHVICDKPLTTTLADAKKLAALVEKTGMVFVLTHNYTGYPMVRQAREMVAEGRARRRSASCRPNIRRTG